MKKNQHYLTNHETLHEFLAAYENHLKENEMVIKLRDATFRVLKNPDPDTFRYEVLVDPFDIEIDETFDKFFK